jgi:hypothetical protein
MPVEAHAYPRPLPNPEWLGKLTEEILEPAGVVPWTVVAHINTADAQRRSQRSGRELSLRSIRRRARVSRPMKPASSSLAETPRGMANVLADPSGKHQPIEWAKIAIAAYRAHRADRIVAERNNGGAMVEATIRM